MAAHAARDASQPVSPDATQPATNAAHTSASQSGPAPEVDAPHTLATSLVMRSDIAQSQQRFDNSVHQMLDDVAQGKDATNHTIAAAGAYNDTVDLMNQPAPNDGQTQRIAALEAAIRDAKPTDTLDDIESRAHVSLAPLYRKSHTDEYGSYGKTASSYMRAAIFDEGRFNNSKVLCNTPLAALQRPGKSVLDPLGANGRVGILLGTRVNAAASNFTKAGTMLLSGIRKLQNHQDPTDDFIGAGAAMGQGVTEITGGALTDFGNHMVKVQSAQAAAALGRAGTPMSEQPGTSGEYTRFGQDDPLEASIDSSMISVESRLSDRAASQQHDLEERVIHEIESGSLDSASLTLQDGVEQIKGSWLETAQLGASLEDSGRQAAQDAHENIRSIDQRAQTLLEELRSQGYDSLDAARDSRNGQVKTLVDRLDELGHLKQQAYDQFNHAIDELDVTQETAPRAFTELADIFRTTSPDERPSRLADWADRYGRAFGKYQNGLLANTDTLPEWFKISKPLRVQLVPTLVNTAFGAVGFGAALDNYLKKQRAGTLTTADRLNLGGQITTFIGGAIGFAPVIGPVLSLALTTVGVALSDFADHFQDWRKSETTTHLKERIREEYERRHPGQGIFGGFEE